VVYQPENSGEGEEATMDPMEGIGQAPHLPTPEAGVHGRPYEVRGSRVLCVGGGCAPPKWAYFHSPERHSLVVLRLPPVPSSNSRQSRLGKVGWAFVS